MQVGDRVRYVGPYLTNRVRKNKKQDLVPGYEGTIIRNVVENYEFPLTVHFDNHKKDLNWSMKKAEVVLAETPNTESEK